jgi:capsular exopolysaccharide synthesis family protein
MNTPELREATLADYLRVIRRRWLLILFVAVICGGIAGGLSVAAKKTYSATAAENIQDPATDEDLVGTPVASNDTPLQIASAHTALVTRPAVVQAVKALLHSSQSVAALRSDVNVEINPNSDLVDITAQSRRAGQAAAVANAFATIDSRLTTAQARDSYSVQARHLAKTLKRITAGASAATQAIYQERLSGLQTLSSIAQPVSVSSLAPVPTSAISPKPARNTVAALLFGLFLGIALAYAREAIDRRLRDTSEVERVFRHQVLGYIGPTALGCSGAPTEQRQTGPATGSDDDRKLTDTDEESFRVLRHNVRYLAAEDSRTLLVTSAMGQEGKSTVAACLAVANAASGKRTLLVECDLRRPVLARRFGINAGPGLSDYLTGHAEAHEILQRVPAITNSANGEGPTEFDPEGTPDLICITCGSMPPRPAELLASDRFQTFVTEVSSVYDMVIIDSPPLLAVADALEIVPQVSAVLVCIRLDQTTRDQARAAQASLDRLPVRPTGVVLTNVRREEEGYYYGYGYTAVGDMA